MHYDEVFDRYMAAGVFSKCLKNDRSGHCCNDPVVYERINGEIKHWIWKIAKGVRETQGCPKKESLSTYCRRFDK